MFHDNPRPEDFAPADEFEPNEGDDAFIAAARTWDGLNSDQSAPQRKYHPPYEDECHAQPMNAAVMQTPAEKADAIRNSLRLKWRGDLDELEPSEIVIPAEVVRKKSGAYFVEMGGHIPKEAAWALIRDAIDDTLATFAATALDVLFETGPT